MGVVSRAARVEQELAGAGYALAGGQDTCCQAGRASGRRRARRARRGRRELASGLLGRRAALLGQPELARLLRTGLDQVLVPVELLSAVQLSGLEGLQLEPGVAAELASVVYRVHLIMSVPVGLEDAE